MSETFEYVSHARLRYKDGYRNAYLGEVATHFTKGDDADDYQSPGR